MSDKSNHAKRERAVRDSFRDFRQKAQQAKREKRLEKAGYKPKKGKFVLMRKGNRNNSRANKTHKKRRHKKRRHTSKRRNKTGHCHNSRGRFAKC